MKIPIQHDDSAAVTADITAMNQRVAARAEQLHDRHVEESRPPLDDWIAAERELLWRPAIEVEEDDGMYIVEAALAGLQPRQIRVRMSPDELLITADVHHQHRHTGNTVVCEFSSGPLFRSYRFPRAVDPSRARAECAHGLLRVTVPLAAVPTA